MKVKVFMNTANSNHEREILRSMYDGIYNKIIPKNERDLRKRKIINKKLGLGTGVEYSYDEKYTKCNLAVMLGSWKPDRSNLHHIVRSSIRDQSEAFICIETPLLNRTLATQHSYQRVGINGFLNRDAIWGEDIDYPADRLKKLGIEYRGWKMNKGNKIVIALQLAGDASLRNNDINMWCIDTIKVLRSHTDRPIEIRTHPCISEKGWSNHEVLFRELSFNNIKDVSFVNGLEVPWEKQILNAYCVVAYTSGLSIDAVINGIPVIACDEGNFAWNVGEQKIRNIEKLNLATEDEVQQWLQNLAYCQWTSEEMESGECWSHLESSVKTLLDFNKTLT